MGMGNLAKMAQQMQAQMQQSQEDRSVEMVENIIRGLVEVSAERQAVEENFTSPDVREGVDAFLTGRKPHFRG